MLTSLLRFLVQRMVRLYAVRENVRLGTRVHIGVGTTLWAPQSLVLDDEIYIGKRCTIEVNGRIGSGTLIANDVGIVGRWDHDHRQVGRVIRHADWVGDGHPRLATSVDVGADVWIGYGAVLLAPVRLGDGCIVAAGAVVVADVPEYAVVAGNPARVVGARFTPEERVRHELALSQDPLRKITRSAWRI